jgi:hypothetical protein
MNLFDKKGMRVFPNQIKKSELCKNKNMLVVGECYCHNGHNLISDKAVFNGFDAIMIKVKRNKKVGFVALDPAYGYKSRVSLNVHLKDQEIWEICCPECNEALPVFSKCECEGSLVSMFLDKKADFSNSILVCNRINCFNAEIRFNNKLLHYSGLDTFI